MWVAYFSIESTQDVVAGKNISCDYSVHLKESVTIYGEYNQHPDNNNGTSQHELNKPNSLSKYLYT